jgi:hypothetical protein
LVSEVGFSFEHAIKKKFILRIDPKDIYTKLSVNPLSFLANPKKIMVKLDMRLKVKLLFFNINVPYTYQDTLARMTGLK